LMALSLISISKHIYMYNNVTIDIKYLPPAAASLSHTHLLTYVRTSCVECA